MIVVCSEGHDGFLLEQEQIGNEIQAFLAAQRAAEMSNAVSTIST
jgi:hypothetical protein